MKAKRSSLLLIILILVVINLPVKAHSPTLNTQVTKDFIIINSSLKESEVRVYTQQKLVKRGQTDQQGQYKFKPSGIKNDFKVVVESSLGHRVQKTIAREELVASNVAKTDSKDLKSTNLAKEEVAKLVAGAVKKQISPLKEQIKRLETELSPNLIEILGGLGYIVGGLGLFYAYRTRRDENNC